MSDQVAYIDLANPAELAEQLDRLRQGFLDALEAGNKAIARQMIQACDELYGEHLGKKWTVTTTRYGGKAFAAQVRVYTYHPYVYGYEFGTKPHPIYPKTSFENGHGGVLAWPSGNPTVFVRYVKRHPGTPAHNKRESLKLRLSITARAEWGQAIADLVDAD